RHTRSKRDWSSDVCSSDLVANYCALIGEPSVLYKDKTYAKKLGYEGIPLPYTYASFFWQKLSIPWLTNDDPVILVEQNFSYDFQIGRASCRERVWMWVRQV